DYYCQVWDNNKKYAVF
nr:immunoglobulin light chain junction region [Macaca mulatta]